MAVAFLGPLPVETRAPAAGDLLASGRIPASPKTPSALAGPSRSAWACAAAAAVAGCSLGAGKRSRRTAAQAKGEDRAEPSRAELLRGLAGAAALPLNAAPARAGSLDGATKTLTEYGLTELIPSQDPPAGWGVVVEPIGLAPDAYYGRFKLGSQPQVVFFETPPLWVITRPNIDFNGAAGTVGANDYGKGDSATLWVDTEFTGSLDTMKPKDFQAEILKALSTKGKGFIEDLSTGKILPGDEPGYKIVTFQYDISSISGSTIARNLVASFSQVGENKLQVFWCGSVTPRWGRMEADLTRMARSFRIGNVPKSIASGIKDFKNMDEKMERSDLPTAPIFGMS